MLRIAVYFAECPLYIMVAAIPGSIRTGIRLQDTDALRMFEIEHIRWYVWNGFLKTYSMEQATYMQLLAAHLIGT